MEEGGRARRPSSPSSSIGPTPSPFALAGLWDEWRGDTDADPVRSATIITTTPNEVMATIHDRMPVILPPTSWDEWLDPAQRDLEAVGRLLVAAPGSLTVMHPVSSAVNDVRNDGPQLAEAWRDDPAEP